MSIVDYDSEPLVSINTLKTKIFQECQVPNLDVNPPNIAKLLQKHPKTRNCSQRVPLLFEVSKDNELVQVGLPEIHGWSNCCYKSFVRGKSDSAKVMLVKNISFVI